MVDYHNIDIFKFIIKYDFVNINFNYIINLLINESDKKEFSDVLLNSYLDSIDKNTHLFQLCLLNEYNNHTIINLIKNEIHAKKRKKIWKY